MALDQTKFQSYDAQRDQLTAIRIIQGLGGNIQTGMCRCPAHNDRTPSLHVSNGRTGRIVFKCHAGCAQEAVINELKARGLWPLGRRKFVPHHAKSEEHERYTKMRDEVWPILRAAGYSRTDQPIEYLRNRGLSIVPKSAMLLPAADADRLTGKRYQAAIYPITGPNGPQGCQITYLSRDGTRNLRGKDKKSIRRFRGSIKGGYIVLGEPKADQPLIVSEGVENGLSAMEIAELPGIAGLSATNMVSINPPQCSEIIIAADNDQVGLNAAKLLAQRLANEGRKVRIAPPPDGTKDWNEAIRGKGANIEQLREHILGAKLVKPEKCILALPIDEFLNLTVPKREYHLRPWLTTGSLCMIHAKRGEAKTWLALSIAHAVASAQSLMRWKCEKQARVLYVDGELPIELLQERLRLFGDIPRDMLMILSSELFEARNKPMPDLGIEEGRKELDEIIALQNPELIVLDSLSTLVRSGIENEAESWAPIQEWLMRHRRNRRSIILVHHQGKGGTPRGSSKREDVLDTVIALKQREPKPGEEVVEGESVFDLEFTKHRRFFGGDAAPMVLRLSTASGRVEWQAQTGTEDLADRVATMLKEGLKQNVIAKELGLSEGRISQLAKKARSRERKLKSRAP